MTLPDHDRDLERLLEGDGGEIGALYRKLSRVEPPRRLDRNVLGEAARAVRGRAPRSQRWLLGLASGAGFVFAAGIAWHIGHDAMNQPGTTAIPITAPAVKQGPGYVPVRPLSEPAREAAPDVPADAAMRVPPPAAMRPAAPVAKPAAPRKREEQAAAAAHAAATPAPSPPLAQPFPESSKATSAAPPPAPAAAAPAPATAPALESLVVSGGASRQQDTPAADQSQEQVVSPEFLKRSAQLRNDARLAPDAWIRHIRYLLQEGRREQAIESLALFRRMHPEVELPDELKSLQ